MRDVVPGVMATGTKGRVFYLTNDAKADRTGSNVAGPERAFQASVAPLGVQVDLLPTAALLGSDGGLDRVTVEQAVEPAPQP
jgi:hypothetical protein